MEEARLLDKVGVEIHPVPDAPETAYPGVHFRGSALLTNHPFDLAYHAAEDFSTALQHRTRAAGFMKNLLQQRLCSSFASGQATAERMLRRESPGDEEENPKDIEAMLSTLTAAEAVHLQTILDELSRPEARDPKLAAVRYFLTEHRTEGKTWLEHGCITFSQYYDTARWVGAELAKTLPGEPVAVYAGAGKSGLFRDGHFASVEREEIKAAVKQRRIRLVVATDAACEGLNLQTLGTLINIDLPWNPSRLKDKYDIFGGLPDTIEDDWIDSEEKLAAMMDQYKHLREKARNAFELRYRETIDPEKNQWDRCSKVLSRRDVEDRLSEPW